MALLVPPPLKRVAVHKRKFQGIAFLLLIALILYLVLAFYNKSFVKTIPVTLRTNSIGNQLSLNADVKYNGVNVGDVRALYTNGEIASLKLAMKPDQIQLIPSNVQARILPKTLFGQKYVDLVAPDGPRVRPLRKGDVIPQDRTRTAIEIEQLYDNLLPFIQTVAPEKLNQTLTAISTALEGRGDKLGDNLVRTDDYLRQINQHLPSLQQDVTGLADVSQILDEAAPDLLRFLDDQVVTSQTIVQKQDTLFKTFTGVADASDLGSTVMSENRNRLIQAPALGVPITRTVARRADNLPLVVNGLAGLVPKIHQVFGGSAENRNWLHINLSVLGNKGAYTQQDCPKNLGPEGNQYGPNCPGGGSSSQGGASVGTSTATPVNPSGLPTVGGSATPSTSPVLNASGLTQADVAELTDPTISTVGSPEEKALINQIVGAVNAQQTSSHDMEPDITDLLLGPMLRGTQVDFQ